MEPEMPEVFRKMARWGIPLPSAEELASVKREVEAKMAADLRASLDRYAKHEKHCGIEYDRACDCGLDEALKRAGIE